MTPAEAQQEIKRLSGLLRTYQYEYYVLNHPSVCDIEYDRLFERLLSIEKEYPEYIKPDSPSARIGSDLTNELPEARHSIPVLSLDKVYSYEELIKWTERINNKLQMDLSFVVEGKIDGVSIVLYYEEGIFTRAVTRGNGIIGNDVTKNVKTIGSVPLRLKRSVTTAVRGEIYLPKKDFEAVNEKQEISFANPRNLASGSLRRIKSSKVADIPLDIFVYEGFFSEKIDSHTDILKELKDLGFRLNPELGIFSEDIKSELKKSLETSWTSGDFNDLKEYIHKRERMRKDLPYEIDGLVVKVNEISVREKLGYTGHHPRWAVAFKFEAPEGKTIIKEINIHVGRTGRITPVAKVHPVIISGSRISNVTLHNQDYINMLELAIGDTVAVSKRGDVIPAVERVIEKNESGYKTWKIPEKCPSCGSRLTVTGAHCFCRNRDCSAQIKGRILFFIDSGQMDIENFGPETVEVLLKEGIIKNVEDIYTCKYYNLLKLPGFGEKKVDLIILGVKKSKNKPYSIVLPSLGIPEIGQKAAELLIEAGYRDVDDLFAIAESNDLDALQDINGIGPKTAETIIYEFSRQKLKDQIEFLRNQGLNFYKAETEELTKERMIFKGQVWCVTGTFEKLKPRSLAMNDVKKRGGRIVSQVTGNTTHLLAGTGSGSKLKKAKELGIAVITEDGFLKILDTGIIYE